MRFVVSSDWDLLMAAFVEETDASFSALVFLMMTWQRGDFGPTVVALWIDSLRAMVPVAVRHTVRKISVPKTYLVCQRQSPWNEFQTKLM